MYGCSVPIILRKVAVEPSKTLKRNYATCKQCSLRYRETVVIIGHYTVMEPGQNAVLATQMAGLVSRLKILDCIAILVAKGRLNATDQGQIPAASAMIAILSVFTTIAHMSSQKESFTTILLVNVMLMDRWTGYGFSSVGLGASMKSYSR